MDRLRAIVGRDLGATLNKPPRVSAPWFGMGCKAQSADIAWAMARSSALMSRVGSTRNHSRIKTALQGAWLTWRAKRRGKQGIKRERAPLPGMLEGRPSGRHWMPSTADQPGAESSSFAATPPLRCTLPPKPERPKVTTEPACALARCSSDSTSLPCSGYSASPTAALTRQG